ncbi:MAG TPA: hypothetical protein PK379_08110 [Candidatus Hydrogenedentes bacterium]|nr:hypothetical protein [Candidatus Hydrogenedentota bacterium]HOK89976.1 hypothetical protein [Candidatus Hydrogenedentota bacterium]
MMVDYIDDLAWAVVASIDLLILFGVGVYFLLKRFHRREDIPPFQEVAILGLALVLVVLETRFLREALDRFPVYYVFSATGVLVTVSALYGHMVVSLLSRFLVEWVTSGTVDDLDRPLFGAAEACMRRGDYPGAVREYLVLARLHPRDPSVFMRLGEALSLVDDHRRAVTAFLRCAQMESNGDRALHALRRAMDHASRDLPEEQRQLRATLALARDRFGGDEQLARRVEEMFRQLEERSPGDHVQAQAGSMPISSLLEKMDDQPTNDG